MKKLIFMAMAATMLFAVAGCKKAPTENPTTTPSAEASATTEAAPASTEAEKPAGGYELALITDVGTIDDKSFNQGSWEGVEAYAKEKDITYKYYKPAEKSDDAYISSIELAVAGGAKVVVCPGFLFEPAVFQMQTKYPDTKFIIIDGEPRDANKQSSISPNTLAVYYAEEQAGFLAGYAAVTDGYRKLGFMGGIPVPAVVRFGYGFVEGAEAAAKDFNIPKGEVEMKYTYVMNFDASPENAAKAASWYSSGTEVIFACGGGVGNSVMKSAETAGGKVIGVDVDQSSESTSVITSAMKNLKKSVYDALAEYYAGNFPGGKAEVLGADVDGIGLPMATSKFTKFDQAKYDELYAKLADGTIKVSKEDVAKKASELPVELVKIEDIQ